MEGISEICAPLYMSGSELAQLTSKACVTQTQKDWRDVRTGMFQTT